MTSEQPPLERAESRPGASRRAAEQGTSGLATADALRPDRFACFVVGDFRDTKGLQRGFVGDTIAAFRDAGAQLYNEAILVTSAGSLPIRAGKAFEVSRKLGRTHQQVLVFVKGDARRATAACGAVRGVRWSSCRCRRPCCWPRCLSSVPTPALCRYAL